MNRRLHAIARRAIRALGASTACALLAACASTPRADDAPSAASERAAPVILDERPWTFDGVEGRVITTAHYRVHTTAPTTASGLLLPRFLESSLARYRTSITPLPEPPRRLDTFMMANRGEWARLTSTELPPSRAARYLRIERGGFAEGGRGFYFDLGVQDTMAIAAHEGWHQYTQATFRDPLPVWLEEGIATWMEGFRWDQGASATPLFLPWANLERFDRLREVHAAGRVLSLEQLLALTPDSTLARSPGAALDYYAQLWALAHFLNDDAGRRAALARVLRDGASGELRTHLRAQGFASGARTGAGVFTSYIEPDLRVASDEYAAFVARVVSTGSRDRVAQGLPPQ